MPELHTTEGFSAWSEAVGLGQVIATCTGVTPEDLSGFEAPNVQYVIDQLLSLKTKACAIVLERSEFDLSGAGVDPDVKLEPVRLPYTAAAESGAVLWLASRSPVVLNGVELDVNDPISHVILVERVRRSLDPFIVQLIHLPSVKLVCSSNGHAYPDPIPQMNTLEAVVPTIRPHIYVGDKARMLTLLKNKTISQEERVASLAFHLFKHSREKLSEIYIQIWDPADPSMPDQEGNMSPQEVFINDWMIYTVLHLIGPSYNNPLDLKAQLHKRLESICAQAGVVAPTAERFNKKLESANWDHRVCSQFMPAIAGMVVAYTQEGKYDLSVTAENVAKYEHLEPGGQSDKFTVALFDAMGMVYQNYCATSVQFAFAAVELAADQLACLGNPFAKQRDAVLALYAKKGKAMYLGCHADTPEDQKVANICLMSFIGFRYHQLNEPKDVESTLKRFNYDGVTKHITEMGHVVLCDQIAQSIAAPTERGLALLLKTATMEVSERLLVGRSPEDLDKLFYYLSTQKPAGVWYDREEERRTNQSRKKWLKEARKVVEECLTDKANALVRIISASTDQDKVSRETRAIRIWENSLMQEIQESTSLKEILAPGVNTLDNTVREDIITKMQPIIQKITSKQL